MSITLVRLSLLSTAAVLALATAASAATVTVNTTATDTAGDGLCGLVEAVQAVNQGSTYRNCTYTANGQSDRIVFSVNGTHTVSGVSPTRTVEIMGRGQGNTIITSSQFCTVCSFNTTGTTRTIWLRDLTVQITNGLPVIGVWLDSTSPDKLATTNVRVSGFAIGINVSGASAFAQLNTTTLENNGTGLSVSGGVLQVTSSTIRNNTTHGIYLTQNWPSIHYNSVSDSTIQNNTGTDGAGIYAVSDADVDPTPTLDITNCTFSGNQATGNGGGLYVQTMTNVTSSVFDNNTAGAIGGGFVAYERDGGYLVEITTSTFKNNRAAYGAGFSNYGPSDGQRVKVSFFQSTFGPANVATADGGGIYSFSQIDTAENLTIHGNQAARGGGLFHDSGGESHLFHCTVTANKATQSGGGGGLWLRTGNPRYAYNLFAENKAGSSNAANNLTIDPGNASLCASYNLLDDVTGIASVFPTTPIGSNCDGANIVGNPRLDTFKNLGGPTNVRPLLASSPALDAIPAAAGDSTDIDQRNWLRPIDGNFNGTASSDIGSVEANSTSTMHEAESLTVAAQSGETLTIENHASYSGAKGRVKQANLNGFVTLQTSSIQAGTYGVIVWYKKASNAGKFKLFTGSSSNPTAQLGGETDAYRPSAQGAQWTKVNLGTITVSTTGAQYFKFLASAKNASSSGHWMFLDAIQLYKSN
jgi:predicted outer membrane repeat protein